MLKLKNITKTFAPNTVNQKQMFQGLNLHVKQGDFIGVIGSNGAGKSSLFNIIAGVCLPDVGKIELDEQNVTWLPEYKRSRYIGRLFQDPMRGTAPRMSIEENLALAYLRTAKKGGGLSRITKKDQDFFRHRLAELGLGIENRMKTPVGLLSGGQRQALTLLMATLVMPKLLLLDEHVAALDPPTAHKVLELTKSIVRENSLTCMMITHSIQSALNLGNRTIMMDNGRIVLDIEGEERAGKTVQDMMHEFKKSAGTALADDRVLLDK